MNRPVWPFTSDDNEEPSMFHSTRSGLGRTTRSRSCVGRERQRQRRLYAVVASAAAVLGVLVALAMTRGLPGQVTGDANTIPTGYVLLVHMTASCPQAPQPAAAEPGDLNFVWPKVPTRLDAPDTIESYQPSVSTNRNGSRTFTWTLNLLQQVKVRWAAVRTKRGCDILLMRLVRSGKFSLGDGRTEPFIELQAWVPRDGHLEWAQVLTSPLPV
jgi:hypothetical protein